MNKAEGEIRRITPVILSGGSGTRLWPLSRGDRPKQMLQLSSERTMLQMTAARVANVHRFCPPILVTAAAHGQAAEDQLRSLGMVAAKVILEPVPRNTAPAIALAAHAAANDELLLVMPSDHLIGNDAAFLAAIETAAPLAEAGWLVTFGIRPSRVETGYGYIKRGNSVAPGAFAVDLFAEKPDNLTATAYLADGGYDWNAGIFLFRRDTFLAELRLHAGDIEENARLAMASAAREGSIVRPDNDIFQSCRSESVDRALMEHAGHVAVVPVDMDWSDVGSWQALYEVAEKDSRGNVASGSSALIDTSNCLIRSEGTVVAAIGVSDLVVVATERAVLIVPRSESQRVPEVLALLAARGEPQT